jgi:hypothetical protein
MKRVLAALFAFISLVGQLPPTAAQTGGVGAIVGSITGPSGPLVGVTVEILDQAGVVVAMATTAETGAFSVAGLQTGSFTVQAVGANGAVLAASSATIAEGAMTIIVTLNATAGILAASATLASSAVGATSGVTSTTVLAALGSAAAAAGAAAVIPTQQEASGSR